METNVVTQGIADMLNVVAQHRTKVLAAVVAIGVGVAGFFMYRVYVRRAQVAAHQTFIAAMKEFEKPVTAEGANGFASDAEKWQKVADIFHAGYGKHHSTTFAPMFLAYEATALVNLNKRSEAITVMKQAVNLMKKTALKSYYDVTLSLMLLDSENTEEQEEGLKRLQAIAENKQAAEGIALYHLGLYAWVKKNFNDVRNYWGQFLRGFSAQAGFEQQIAMVQERLDLLEV